MRVGEGEGGRGEGNLLRTYHRLVSRAAFGGFRLKQHLHHPLRLLGYLVFRRRGVRERSEHNI